MWSLARRFSPHPLWATLLFVVTPAFVINGNSLEADIPFLAFWMAGVALFVAERYAFAALALALASLAAYQAIFLVPILAVYAWLFARRSRLAWAAILVAPVTLVAWQLYEFAGVGELPAGILVGHFQTYGFQSLANKLKNAALSRCMPAVWCSRPAAAGLLRVTQAARSRYDLPRIVVFDLLHRHGGDLLCRIGALSVADGRAGRAAYLQAQCQVARRGICGAGGSERVARHRELSALGWLPRFRGVAAAAARRQARVDQWRVGAALLFGIGRRTPVAEGAGGASGRGCGFE